MENLHRRASGIYVARLAVPGHLRRYVGKREFIATTGTRHLPVAKLVASTLLAGWRQQFLDLERLALSNSPMNHDSIIKIADGHPLLAGDSCLPVEQAAAVLGLAVQDIVRNASEGRLGVFHRVAALEGYLVVVDALERDDGMLGTVDVPAPSQMPQSALHHCAHGLVQVPANSVRAVADSLLVTGEATVVMFTVPGGDPDRAFVPNNSVQLTFSNIEFSTLDLQKLRGRIAASIPSERVIAAREAMKLAANTSAPSAGRNAHRRISEALDVYARDFLPQKITSAKEVERVKTGIALFIEFEGNMQLKDIDAECLRSFRDKNLSRVLANENKVRIKFKTSTMTESIAAVAGKGWPNMSASERDLRMQWIARMFKWLKEQKWILENPMTGLAGESVETKAARRVTAITQKNKVRQPFDDAAIQAIFSAPWFLSGAGVLTAEGTYREFSPFRYWLPLLGLYAGGRIAELCQLRLDDVAQTPAGTWFLDINENTADKSLKKQKDTGRVWAKRKVPVHPHLVELGFTRWCDRLRAEGFLRVFPELSWSATTHYAKEPIRAMSQFFLSIGLPRDNTKVFHSFRHGFNNAVARSTCSPEWRKRLMGHEPGAGVNEQHYLADPS